MRSEWRWTVAGLVPFAAAFIAGAPMPALAQEDTSITIVTATEPDTLDSCETAHAAIGVIAKNNIAETLIDIDPNDGSLHPRLATSWEQLDEDTWRFHLVENARFTDGTPFNAAAVVFSIERSMRPDRLTCAAASKGFPAFRLAAEAVDEFTVDVTADKPAPIMHIGFTVLPMTSPNTDVSALTRSPVGTGPYVLAKWVSGIEVILERNEDYWGETPEVSQVKYVFRNEPAVRAAMVETGEADIALEITEQDADNPEIDFPYFNAETTWVRLDEQYPPLDDERVRRALAYSVDRESMLGTVITDAAIPAAQLPGPSIDGHNPDLENYPYDPDRARELIAEAAADGVPVDAPIRFLGRIGVFANAEEVMQVLTQMFNRVGFNVSLELMERARHAQFQAKPFPENVGPNVNLIMSDNNRGDASFSIFGNFHSKGQQSATVLHPDLDRMIEEAATLTGEARTKAHQAVLKKIHDEVIAIPLFYMMSFTRVSDRLEWVPSIQTNSQIEIQDIKFARN